MPEAADATRAGRSRPPTAPARQLVALASAGQFLVVFDVCPW
ncbi:hypothetical protein [Streptomyces zaehneri]|nr:hypothetical protein [Streptomyces sp. DSM 40713]